MRMFFHMGLSARGGSAHGVSAPVLRLQARGRPGSRPERSARQRHEAASPEGAVVNARLALPPQLPRIGPQPIAAPVERPGDVGAHAVRGAGAAGHGHAEALRLAAHRLEERRAGGDRLALLARPGAHSTLPGAGSAVGIAVGGRGPPPPPPPAPPAGGAAPLAYPPRRPVSPLPPPPSPQV